MPALSLKQKIIATNLSIFLGLLLILIIIIVPAIRQILSLRQDIDRIENNLEQKYEETKKLRKSLQELNSIRQQTSLFKQATLQTGEELQTITTLEKIARQNNIEQNLDLNLTNNTTNKQEKNTHLALPTYYQLSFLNNGLMADHLRYLTALENLPFYIIIDSLNFEKRPGTKTNQISPVTARLEATIYVETNN